MNNPHVYVMAIKSLLLARYNAAYRYCIRNTGPVVWYDFE